jgi:hypothetical protein
MPIDRAGAHRSQSPQKTDSLLWSRTGMLLPKEGTLRRVTENLGRRLLLIPFDDGNCEYLFDDEVECLPADPCPRRAAGARQGL